jgi:hypothetical protein
MGNETRAGLAVGCVAGLAASLFIIQTALAHTDVLTVRFVLNLVTVASTAMGVMELKRRTFREVNGPAPEPISLILAGLAALGLWVVAWWLMDMADYGLNHVIGSLASPKPITEFSDSLFGLDLQPAAYELEILFAVVLLPLVEAWLLWGLLQPELGALFGRWRAAWITGGVSGAFMALTAVQNVAPALPWGLASLDGYVVIGCVAALAVYLTGSPWTGFAAWGTFAYASFAWRDDLFREFAGKPYWDVGWLTLILVGVLVALVAFQAIRFRNPRPAEPERASSPRTLRVGPPLLLLLAAVVVMVIVDINAR